MDQTTGPILVVAHAGVNRVLLCHLLGMPLRHLFRLGQDYAGLNIIQVHPEGYRVLALNWKGVCDTRPRMERKEPK